MIEVDAKLCMLLAGFINRLMNGSEVNPRMVDKAFDAILKIAFDPSFTEKVGMLLSASPLTSGTSFIIAMMMPNMAKKTVARMHSGKAASPVHRVGIAYFMICIFACIKNLQRHQT